MESKEEKLTRQLRDLDNLIADLDEISDKDMLDHCYQKRASLLDQLMTGRMRSQNTELNEALTILMEECGELIQACSKIIRFGDGYDNVRNLVQEMGDVDCLVNILQSMDIVSYTDIEEASQKKYAKLKVYSNLPLD